MNRSTVPNDKISYKPHLASKHEADQVPFMNMQMAHKGWMGTEMIIWRPGYVIPVADIWKSTPDQSTGLHNCREKMRTYNLWQTDRQANLANSRIDLLDDGESIFPRQGMGKQIRSWLFQLWSKPIPVVIAQILKSINDKESA